MTESSDRRRSGGLRVSTLETMVGSGRVGIVGIERSDLLEAMFGGVSASHF